MKFLELFAGIGAFRRGLEEAGHMCVGYVEWDKFARQSYEAIWPEARSEWNATDITTVTDDDLRRLSRDVGGVDLLAFGFPCQAFSVAGKRGGFADTRGTLVYDALRFASVLGCKYLLAENVPGLLSHDGGRTFYTILCAMDELGYDCEWELCNAKNFGIPQNRERLFLVGHLRGHGRGKIFPLGVSDSETHCILAGRLALPGKDQWNRVYDPAGVSPTLTTMQGGRQEPKVIAQTDALSPTLRAQWGHQVPHIVCEATVINIDARGGLPVSNTVGTIRANAHGNHPMVTVESGLIHSRGFETRKDGISHCVKGAEGGSSKNFIKVSAVSSSDYEVKQQNGRRIKEPDEPMFTLTAQDRHGVLVTRKGRGEETEWVERDEVTCLDANYFKGLDCHQARTGVANGVRIRKLTPLEVWRLMGRADWEHEAAKAAGVSDSQRYKQAGNSLIPQIVAEIAKRLAAIEEDTSHEP